MESTPISSCSAFAISTNFTNSLRTNALPVDDGATAAGSSFGHVYYSAHPDGEREEGIESSAASE